MNIWVLVLLCVIQGLTEFLPVSSSGHLLLVEQLFGVSENSMLLNLFLHVSTLLAVIIVYRKTIWMILRKPFQPLTYKLLIATIFSVILAFAYEFFGMENVITKIYPFGFLLTSFLLLVTVAERLLTVFANSLALKSVLLSDWEIEPTDLSRARSASLVA